MDNKIIDADDELNDRIKQLLRTAKTMPADLLAQIASQLNQQQRTKVEQVFNSL